jgi:PPM family protein phosphatase
MAKIPPHTLIHSYGLSDIGLVRKNNEDYWSQEKDIGLYALADGMGGHSAGEVAAEDAVCLFMRIVRSTLENKPIDHTPQLIKQILKYAARQANWIVYQKSQENKELSGMGTTFCAIYFFERKTAAILHVGDSRIYRLRDGSLTQLTQDHSVVRNLCGSGKLDATEVGKFSFRNLITRSIGHNARVKPSVATCSVAVGDIYMMCSDGLSDYVAKKDIQSIMTESSNIERASKTLIDKANSLGGQDNITVVLMKVEEANFE